MRAFSVILILALYTPVFAQPGKVTDPILHQLDDLLFDSRYTEAIQVADQYKSSHEPVRILVLNKKAEAQIRQGKFDEAGKTLQECIRSLAAINNPEPQKSVTQSNLGFLYLNQGRNDLALDILVPAATALQQTNASLENAQALTYLALVYLNTGKYAQAEELQLMALSIRKDNLPEVHELVAASYNDLGLIYSRLDPDKALDNYEKATIIYQKLHGNEHPKFAIANTNQGVIYLQMQLFGDAVNYFETALKIWEKQTSQPNPSKAFVLQYLGITYSQMGNRQVGLEYYNKALSMYESSYGKKHPDVAYMHLLIGNEYQSEDEYDQALSSYQQSLIANISDFEATDINVNPNGKIFYSGTQLLYSLMEKAETLEARHLGKTLKLSDLTLALSTLHLCDSLIDQLRQQTSNEADKISLGNMATEVYADGVRIAHLLSEVSFTHRPQYRELSFYFAEKSKSAVLQDAISDANAKSFANIPAELLEEEKSLKAAMALVTQKLAQKPTEEEEKYLRETSFHLNQSYQEFTRQLETKYPDYFNLKFNSAAPSIAQLQTLLDESTAILSYFLDYQKDSERSRIFTYVITKKSFQVKEQNLPKDYDKLLSGYRNSMYFSNEPTFLSTSRSLGRLLIPKGLPAHITNLAILPSGRMSVIPFEALLTQPVKDVHAPFRGLPYLINNFSIRYEFSAGLILQKKAADNFNISSARLLAPVTFPEKDNLSGLPGTEKEVREISKLLASRNISCQVLLNQNANESVIKGEDLNQYSLIHLATHGIVDEDNPELSRIFLFNDSDAEDGNLFSGEIYNLHLNANLITLSACQTGLGKISKGEGVVGLSRALVYAGAKNLIVSFWSVADESTAELMTNFYQNLLQTQNRGFAPGLRNAKLKMIETDKYSAPYYWAPFVLIGY